MKKCVRLAGCVAFNFIEGEKSFCDMFGQLSSLVNLQAGEKGSRGHFSETCNEVKDLTDYRKQVLFILFD